MTDNRDSWKEVSSKAEALGLKLKLHMEREADSADDTAEEGSTKATLDDFGRKLQDAFESLGAAAKDPAVKADFKEMGLLFKDAITDTFSSVSTDVGEAMKKAARRGDGESDDSGTEDVATPSSTADDSPPSSSDNGDASSAR
jgi:hypothetical protein